VAARSRCVGIFPCWSTRVVSVSFACLAHCVYVLCVISFWIGLWEELRLVVPCVVTMLSVCMHSGFSNSIGRLVKCMSAEKVHVCAVTLRRRLNWSLHECCRSVDVCIVIHESHQNMNTKRRIDLYKHRNQENGPFSPYVFKEHMSACPDLCRYLFEVWKNTHQVE